MRHGRLLLLLALAVQLVPAKVVFEDGFEKLDANPWKQNISGEGGKLEIVDDGVHGKCLKITASGGTTYLTMELDPARFRGSTLIMSGMVKLENATMGAQTYSTPKLHFAQRTEGSKNTENQAERWVGSFDWTLKTCKIDVADDCNFLILDIGNQGGGGVMYIDDFKLEDTFGQGRPVGLAAVCNTGRGDGVANDGRGSFLDTGPLDLFNVPEGNLETDEVTFYLPKLGDNGGMVMIALQGKEREKLPPQTQPVEVGKKVGQLTFLHASAWADPTKQQPCYTAVIEYADGQTERREMKAGVDLANYDDAKAYANCRVAWTGKCAAGKTVGLTMASWDNPRPDVLVQSLQFESAGHGVPLILAVTYTPVRPKGK